MKKTKNKGEWSELYALLKIIGLNRSNYARLISKGSISLWR